MSASKLFRLFLNGAIAILILSVMLLIAMLDTAPENALQWRSDVHLARNLFKKTADAAQSNKDLNFNEVELNHALNSILNRYLRSITIIKFAADDSAEVKVTLQLPKKLSHFYINGQFRLINKDTGLGVEQLRIGKLSINKAVADVLINYVLKHSMLKHYYLLAKEHIQAIQIYNQQLNIHYQINTLKSHYNAIANSIDAETLRYYQQQIENIVSQHNPHQRLSLAGLLQPLFNQARLRSTPETAITENIAIIFAVTAYVNSNEIPFYLPIKAIAFSSYQFPVYLFKRTDQAKHFTLSAALTSTGGAQLADILGQEKELRDAQSISGFSFIDIAADRAGMKFTEQAIRSPQEALEFQKIMSEIKDYSSFMPDVHDLPEKLTHAQFTSQYDSISSKAYKQLIQEIDNRIEALPIYPKHEQVRAKVSLQQ